MQQHRIITYEELAKERRVTCPSSIEVLVSGRVHRVWCNSRDMPPSECLFKAILTHRELSRDGRAAAIIRHNPELQVFFPLHPTVDIIKISGFHYLTYYNKSVVPIPPRPFTTDELSSLFNYTVYALKAMHDKDILHNGVGDEMFFHGTYTAGKFTNIPMLLMHGSFKTFKQFKDEGEYLESCLCSPLQVVLEMLSSNTEPELIEYKTFKTRMQQFWQFLITKKMGKPVIKWAQEYFSGVAGAVDYFDFLLNRYCILQEMEGSLHVVKDKCKALGYLHDIDLFNMGIMFQIKSGNGQQLNATLKRAIGECMRGEYISPLLGDEDLLSVVRPFDGKEPEEEKPAPQIVEAEPETIVPTPEPIQPQAVPPKPRLRQMPTARQSPTPRQTPAPIQAPTTPPPPAAQKQMPTPRQTPPTPKPVVQENSCATPLTITFKNDTQGLSAELQPGSGLKKLKVQNIERIIRNDGPDGEYIVWKGGKLYLNPY